jgi:hypothetical protein
MVFDVNGAPQLLLKSQCAGVNRAASKYAALAQLVEHIIRNDGVVGSNPISGTIFPAGIFWVSLRKCRKWSFKPLRLLGTITRLDLLLKQYLCGYVMGRL